jgi:TonB-linked SusC/RagA family outer membrane protein
MKTRFTMFLTLCLSVISTLAVAQQKTVSGTVVDEAGIPLPGATILVVGTTNGTSADFDGNYSIIASVGETLEFSFVGYSKTTVTVGSSDIINVTLQLDNSLDEVVVTALGLERKKDNDISSATLIKSDQIVKSGEAGLLQGVAGKSSGVLITQTSGDPGAGAFIQIRGQNTVLGDSSPLIIVDGVPISNSSFGSSAAGVVQQSRLNDIPASDIASMTILKGAAAAAVWGSGAANGVVVIQTKRGLAGAGRLDVNFSASLSMDEVNREHEKQGVFGQGAGGVWSSNASGLSWGDKIADRKGGSDVYNTSGAYFIGDITGRTYYPITEKNSQEVFNDVNRDQVFRTGIQQNYNLGVNFSASEKSSTYFSYTRLDSKGVINGLSDYLRNTFRINQTNKLSDKIETRINTSFINIKSNRIQTGSNLNGLYLGYIRTAADFDNTDHIGTYYTGPNDAVGRPNSHRSYRNRQIGEAPGIYNNPGWTINENTNPNEVIRFTVAPEVNITLSDKLKFTGRYGMDFYVDRRENYYPANSSGDWTQGGFYKNDYSETIQNINLFLNGNESFGENFGLNYVVGYVLEQNEYYRFSANANVFLNPDPSKQLLGNAVNGNILASEYKSKDVKNSVYYSVSLDLFKNLLVDIAGRLERTTTLTDLNFYPAVTAGYVAKESGSGALSFLKLRASYGQVGISPSLYLNASNFITSTAGSEGWGDYIDGANYGGSVRRSNTQGNPDLTVERVTETEFGFDSRFFDNKLSLGFTYYDRLTTDGILSVEVPATTGFTSRYVNAAEISNSGVEFDFSYDLYKSGDFSMNLFGNFTAYKNIVEKLPDVSRVILAGFTSTGSVVTEGESFAAIFGGRYERNSDGSIATDPSGFPLIADTQGVIGDPNPDFRAGLGMNMDYKALNFSFLFETSQGNDMWGGTQGVMYYFGVHPDTANELVAPVDLPIYGSSNVIPAGTTFRGNVGDFGGGLVALDESWYRTNGGGFGDLDEQFIQDASWIKLREVSLNYQLPKTLLNTLGAKSGQLGLAGRNFIIKSNFVGVDPEVNLEGASKGRGLDYFTNPGTSSVLLNLKLNF